MHWVGFLMVGGVSLWLFIVTLPFIWWLWALLLGFYLIVRWAKKP